MRQVVLDTETTGLSPQQGHRITEIGCLEMVNRRSTGNTFQTYLNPEREVDAGAARITGLSWDKLRDEPKFAEVVDDFMSFINGAELIIHNAPFDLGFLDHELKIYGHQWKRISDHLEIIDTLVMAREMHPGQKNNLDALCKRYSIDNSHRNYHGALLDSEILANVYIAMTSGQTDMQFEAEAVKKTDTRIERMAVQADNLRIIEPTAAEEAAHAEMLDLMKE